MGGCRCSFRDCNVNTTEIPGMHFYHYPIKQNDRYIKWLRLAGNMDYLSTPYSRQKNRVVCTRHFRVECFKNYRRDRLVATDAVAPTLMPFNDDLALDYANAAENDGCPELIKLPKCELKHLIPPKGFQFPFTFHDNITAREYVIQNDIKLATSTSEEILTLIGYDKTAKRKILNFSSSEKRSRMDEGVFRIEHVGKSINIRSNEVALTRAIDTCKSGNANGDNNRDKEKASSAAKDGDTFISASIMDINEELELDMLEQLLKADSDTGNHDADADDDGDDKDEVSEIGDLQLQSGCVKEMSKIIKDLEQQLRCTKEQLKLKTIALEKTEAVLKKTVLQKKEVQCKYYELYENHKKSTQVNIAQEKKIRSLREGNSFLQEKCSRYEKEIREIREHQEQKHLTTVSTTTKTIKKEAVTASSDSTSQRESPTMAAAAAAATTVAKVATNNMQKSLTKPQLFNNIKKYISSSMLALLHLEMFGHSGQQVWNSDEMRVSMDLLQLGEEVFRYISDEWRLRLPPIAMVQKWRDQDNDLADSDGEDA